MTCAACIAGANKGAFTRGTNSLRHTTLATHDKQQQHQICVRAFKAAEARAAAAEAAGQKVQSMLDEWDSILKQHNTESINALIKRLKVVYHLMLRDRPLSDYLPQLGLARDLDTPELLISALLSKFQYESHRFAEEASEAIAEYLWQRALEDIRASPTLGLLLDESTDVANVKQLIVYISGVAQGKAFTKFATLIPLADGKANTITEAVLRFISEQRIELLKFIGLGSDGASVMTGA